MLPKISVIAVTARAGGFDILVNCFAAQTFPQHQFEVIIVDSFWDERHEFVKDRLPGNFEHLKLENERPFYDACYANNFGLANACGELIIHFCDMNWAHERCLEEHWRIYTEHKGYSLSGFCDRFPIPKLKEPKVVQGGTGWDWEEIAWSCFQEDLTAERANQIFTGMEPSYRERKGITTTGLTEISGNVFYAALNESIPMSVLKEINGWDMDYDGGRGSADTDLGMRANYAGWKFLCDPSSAMINRKFGQEGTSHVFPTKPKEQQPRTTAQNAVYFDHRAKQLKEGACGPRCENGLDQIYHTFHRDGWDIRIPKTSLTIP